MERERFIELVTKLREALRAQSSSYENGELTDQVLTLFVVIDLEIEESSSDYTEIYNKLKEDYPFIRPILADIETPKRKRENEPADQGDNASEEPKNKKLSITYIPINSPPTKQQSSSSAATSSVAEHIASITTLSSRMKNALKEVICNKKYTIEENFRINRLGEDTRKEFLEEFVQLAIKRLEPTYKTELANYQLNQLKEQSGQRLNKIILQLLRNFGYNSSSFSGNCLFAQLLKIDTSLVTSSSSSSSSASNSNDLSTHFTKGFASDYLDGAIPSLIAEIKELDTYKTRPDESILENFRTEALKLHHCYPYLIEPSIIAAVKDELINNIKFLAQRNLNIKYENILASKEQLNFAISISLGFRPRKYFYKYIDDENASIFSDTSDYEADSDDKDVGPSEQVSPPPHNNAAIDSSTKEEIKVFNTKLEKTTDDNILKPKSFSDILAKIAEFVKLHFQHVFTQSEENSQFTCNSAFGKKEIALEIINVEENKHSITEGKIISLSPLFETSVKSGNEEFSNSEYFEFTPEVSTNNLEKYAAAGVAAAGLVTFYGTSEASYGTIFSGEYLLKSLI